jgi:hypothetical protein
VAATAVWAQKTIKIDFSSTADFEESSGKKGKAQASTLTAAQKQKVIDQVQKQYDDAVGTGKVTVSEGTGGDYDMIVSGATAPDAGAKYGNAGKPGKPGLVYEKEFTNDGFSGNELVNGIAESTAHEAGHKLGLGHNWDNPPTKMTEGSKVDTATRKADARKFNADDTKKLTNSLALNNSEHKDSFAITDLGVFVGQHLGFANKPDELLYLDAYATFIGPPGATFGYMSFTDEYVFQGDTTDSALNPTFMTFLYTGGVDLGVSLAAASSRFRAAMEGSC